MVFIAANIKSNRIDDFTTMHHIISVQVYCILNSIVYAMWNINIIFTAYINLKPDISKQINNLQRFYNWGYAENNIFRNSYDKARLNIIEDNLNILCDKTLCPTQGQDSGSISFNWAVIIKSVKLNNKFCVKGARVLHLNCAPLFISSTNSANVHFVYLPTYKTAVFFQSAYFLYNSYW